MPTATLLSPLFVLKELIEADRLAEFLGDIDEMLLFTVMRKTRYPPAAPLHVRSSAEHIRIFVRRQRADFIKKVPKPEIGRLVLIAWCESIQSRWSSSDESATSESAAPVTPTPKEPDPTAWRDWLYIATHLAICKDPARHVFEKSLEGILRTRLQSSSMEGLQIMMESTSDCISACPSQNPGGSVSQTPESVAELAEPAESESPQVFPDLEDLALRVESWKADLRGLGGELIALGQQILEAERPPETLPTTRLETIKLHGLELTEVLTRLAGREGTAPVTESHSLDDLLLQARDCQERMVLSAKRERRLRETLSTCLRILRQDACPDPYLDELHAAARSCTSLETSLDGQETLLDELENIFRLLRPGLNGEERADLASELSQGRFGRVANRALSGLYVMDLEVEEKTPRAAEQPLRSAESVMRVASEVNSMSDTLGFTSSQDVTPSVDNLIEVCESLKEEATPQEVAVPQPDGVPHHEAEIREGFQEEGSFRETSPQGPPRHSKLPGELAYPSLQVASVSPPPIDLVSTSETLLQVDTSEELAPRSGEPSVLPLPHDVRDTLALIADLLEQGRAGLAALLAATLPDHPEVPRPWLLEALALASQLRSQHDEVAEILRSAFAEFSSGILLRADGTPDVSMQLLAVAASIRPTLLAPGTGASALLRVAPALEVAYNLRALCEVMIAHVDSKGAIDPRVLSGVVFEDVWETELEEIRANARKWYDVTARGMTMKFQKATMIWRRWLDPRGMLSELLHPVLENDLTQLEFVEAEATDLMREDVVDARMDQELRKLTSEGKPPKIVSSARIQMCDKTREAAHLALRWVSFHREQAGRRKSFDHQQLQELRSRILSAIPAIEAELALLPTDSAMVRAGVTACRGALSQVVELFEARERVVFTDKRPILAPEVLLAVGLELDEECRPVHPDRQALNSLAGRDPSDPDEYAAAFQAQVRAGDHEAAQRTLIYLTRLDPTHRLLEGGQDDLSVAIREKRMALRQDVQALQQQVERAVANGLLNEDTRSELLGRIEIQRRSLEETQRFYAVAADLKKIHQDLSAVGQQRIELLRAQVKERGVSTESLTFRQIESALDKRDVTTATEYLLRGGTAEESRNSLPLVSFLPALRAIEKALSTSEMTPQRLARIVDSGETFAQDGDFPGLSTSQIPRAHVEQSSQALRAWEKLKRSRGVARHEEFLDIVRFLGFRTAEVLSVTPCNSLSRIELRTQPLKTKEECPVASFGSGANGHYYVICSWALHSEEDLLRDLQGFALDGALIVFLFAVLPEEKRRRITNLCWTRKRTFIVIDEVMLFHLVFQQGERLSTMFNSTLPYTYLLPYQTTASMVPPELFFGRRQERRSIEDREGTCFIYGGRQLGKTALLRAVQANFHEPDKNRVASWIDLKSEGIGYQRNLDDFWQVLAHTYKKNGVLSATVQDFTQPPKLIAKIEDWLLAVPERRILLLLDEADRFLEADALVDFTHTHLLKGLMEKTNRRFKVVFAGLHNVLRTTRIQNQPLAHLGKPICIGPLFNDAEWREALALLAQPMASMGFQFGGDPERQDYLASQILGRTNYYPSLIQIYGHELLSHVTNSHKVPFRWNSPPHLITSRHVEEVHESSSLREQIQARFLLTLQLDTRYELIAYALAYQSLEDPHKGLVEGFSQNEIRDLATWWWSEGFQERSTEDAFPNLLGEMVGLGVLREVRSEIYALRNHSLIDLLGGPGELERKLTGTREMPQVYKPEIFRATWKDRPGARSPLTAQQLLDLTAPRNGITLLYGIPASGMGEVVPYLREFRGGRWLQILDPDATINVFAARLRSISDRPVADTTNLIVVPATCAWDSTWLTAAWKVLGARKSVNSYLRVLFLADAAITWRMAINEGHSASVPSEALQETCLTPWALGMIRIWLEDLDQPRDLAETILGVTGGWPALIARAHEACEGRLQRLREVLQSPDLVVPSENTLASSVPELTKPVEIMRFLCEIEASTEEIAEYFSETRSEDLHATLAWGERLGLIYRDPRKKWRAVERLKALM